jgi:hypothetical protein
MVSHKRKNGKGADNRLLYLGMAVAAVFWCFEAIVRTIVFKEADLITNLVYPEPN